MEAPEVQIHSNLEVVPQYRNVQKPYPDLPASNYEAVNAHQAISKRVRTILGLRITTFFLTLALILIILAAAIGGGIGGTMAVNSAKNSNKIASTMTSLTSTTTTVSALNASSTPSTSPTPSPTTVSVPTTGTLPLNCPTVDNTNIRITLQSTSLFAIHCGQDFDSSADIVAIVAYTLADCARACTSYNLNWKGKICKAATFNSDLGGSVPRNYGTCFLKNGTGSPSFSESNVYVALVLQ